MRVFLVVFLASALTTSCRLAGVQPQLPPVVEQWALPRHITIVSWNVHKQRDARLRTDLHALVRQQRPTLVFLQEATAELLDSMFMTGHFAPSWQYPLLAGSATGVLTFSQVVPTQSEVMPTYWREFFLATPKVALATEYLLPDGA